MQFFFVTKVLLRKIFATRFFLQQRSCCGIFFATELKLQKYFCNKGDVAEFFSQARRQPGCRRCRGLSGARRQTGPRWRHAHRRCGRNGKVAEKGRGQSDPSGGGHARLGDGRAQSLSWSFGVAPMTSQGRRGQRSESERRRGTSAARRSASGTVALGEAALVLRGGHGGFERWFHLLRSKECNKGLVARESCGAWERYVVGSRRGGRGA